MSKTLAEFLRQQLDLKQWSQRELARQAGIQASSLSKIMGNPNQEPELPTLKALATALGVELYVLVEAAGYPMRRDLTEDAKLEHIRVLVESAPELSAIAPMFARLTPQDRAAVLAVTEALIRAKQERTRTAGQHEGEET